MKNKEEEIEFVAKNYRHGAFNAKTAWAQMGLAAHRRRFVLRVAASIAAIAILSATAALIIKNTDIFTSPTHVEQPGVHTETSVSKVIDFDNTPLSEVLASISETYSIEVDNVPDNAAELKLTLHYEGDAAKLIETINDILDTDITIKK